MATAKHLLTLLITSLGIASAQSAHAAAAPQYLLLVYASGGWDQSMVFDNKLQSTAVANDPTLAQATAPGNLAYLDSPNRPATHQFFTTYGAQSAIINGIGINDIAADAATKSVFTMIPTGKNRPVDWLTYYAATVAPKLDLPHVVIDAPFCPGEYEASVVHLTSTTIGEYGVAPDGTAAFDGSGEAALAAFRDTAYAPLGGLGAPGSLDAEKAQTLAAARLQESLLTKRLKAAQGKVGASGSDSAFAHNGKLAVALFAAGASVAATVQAGPVGLFATTSDNFNGQNTAYESLFGDLASILAFASSEGIAKQLTVVVISERGRAPALNAAGGKGPWPYTSALVLGPNIAGGVTVGLTDSLLRAVPIDPTFGSQNPTGPGAVGIGNVMTAVFLAAGMSPDALPGTLLPLAPILSESTNVAN